jgi:hypothetical protein
MNFMIFIRARADRDPRAFQDWYRGRFAPALLTRHQDLGRFVINLTEKGPGELLLAHDSSDPAERYDVVTEVALDSVATFRAIFGGAAGAEVEGWADRLHAYRVSDTVILDKEPPRSERLPGYKLLRELLFYTDLPDRAAQRLWTHHARLALKVHVGMTRYLQHWVEERLSPDAPATRGISELYFPTREELAQRYYESPRGRDEILHDTGHFIEQRLPRVYAREFVLKP